MAYEHNNSGSLFKNDRKQNDRQPDYTGTAIIDGKTKRISAWMRTSRDGSKKYMSLAFDEPQQAYPQNAASQQPQAPAPAPAPKAAPAAAPVVEDDLPF